MKYGREIDEINKFMEENDENHEPELDISLNCLDPYRCDFWNYCIRNLPKPNVFDIPEMRKKKKFAEYYKGNYSFENLQYEKLNKKYLEQIDFEINNLEPKIDKSAIKKLLDSLKYPLYFVDYETFQMAIPEVVGTRPYQQLPFQYSLHIIKEKGAPVEHKEFLAETYDNDFIRHFAESLIKDIPDDGSVIIYNKSFEPTINRKIAELYPEYAEDMARINKNIVDFMDPFKKRQFYVKEMNGASTIKIVLPSLFPDDPALNYHDLPVVHNGTEASNAFLFLREQPKEEQEKIRQGLLKYCGLDTLAMVKIWEKFNEVTGE